MRRILPTTLFWQLVVGTILVQTLFLGVFISYIVVSSRTQAQERTRTRMLQQIDRLAVVCSKELARGDMAALHDVLELSRISPTIDGARITDMQGKTLAVSDGANDTGLDKKELALLHGPVARQVFQIKNGMQEAVTPLEVQGKPAVLLWLEPNRALSLNTANTVVRICLSYGGFALLANLLPIFLIVRTITKPLKTLREATQKVIRNPDKSGAFPLPITTRNEAGALTSSFNGMVRELDKQRSGLLETLALLDSMLRNAPIGFAFFDSDLRYVRVNDFLAGLHGLPVEEHLGRMPTDVYPASIGEPKTEYLRKVFESGDALHNVELSGEMPHVPGVPRTWLMHFYPVQTKQVGTPWVGVIVVEVTEQRKAEEALRKTEKLAAVGRLAASIAHEINNPLEAVTNLLYLLRTHDPMDAEALEFVALAESELERVSEITQQTLRFHRQSTLPQPTNLVEVLDSLLKLYQARAHSMGVTVVRKYDGEPEVFGFGGELRQVFANLIGNALDAMPSGGRLMLRVRRGHGARSDGKWVAGVRVSVTDTGTGMTEETMQRVFEAFFTTKQATGTGLGLWISEEILRKHSGTVRVRSRVGEGSGTSFMIFFPDDGVGDDAVAGASVEAVV